MNPANIGRDWDDYISDLEIPTTDYEDVKTGFDIRVSKINGENFSKEELEFLHSLKIEVG